jgi:hypothetical protein
MVLFESDDSSHESSSGGETILALRALQDMVLKDSYLGRAQMATYVAL